MNYKIEKQIKLRKLVIENRFEFKKIFYYIFFHWKDPDIYKCFKHLTTVNLPRFGLS